jgi:hypothetical protein
MLKNFFLIILLYLCLASNAISTTFNWTKVTVSENGTTELFYDKDTVFKVGANVYFWQLTNNLANVKKNIFSTISHIMVNCNTYEARNITYTDFKRPMSRGASDMEMIIPESQPDYFDWVYYSEKETIQGLVLKEVCKNY